MKRIITLGVVSILSSFVLVGCGSDSPSPSGLHDGYGQESEWTTVHTGLSQKKIRNIIKDAGEKDGWRMTEFKKNAILADKTDGDDLISTTVYFDKNSFTTDPENSDLEDAIGDALKKHTSSE